MALDRKHILDWIERTKSSIREGCQWDLLLRISCSQLVMIGSYATLLVPIIAHVLLLAKQIDILPVSFQVDTSLLPGPNPPVDQVAPLWKYLATQIYFGGLLMVGGKLLVQILCPPMILRYPDQNEYIKMAASARRAGRTLDKLVGDHNRIIDPVDALVIKRRENYEAHLNGWKAKNRSKPFVRHIAAVLLIGGTLLAASFVAIRFAVNFRTVMSGFWG